MSQALIFTEKAAAKVWSLISDDGNLNLKLRVFVTGGGCSGLRYDFTFDETGGEDDEVISRAIQSDQDKEPVVVSLLVDPLSLQYLTGAEIDYQENIEGEQFIIRNPNAKTTCGCGSSFTTDK